MHFLFHCNCLIPWLYSRHLSILHSSPTHIPAPLLWVHSILCSQLNLCPLALLDKPQIWFSPASHLLCVYSHTSEYGPKTQVYFACLKFKISRALKSYMSLSLNILQDHWSISYLFLSTQTSHHLLSYLNAYLTINKLIPHKRKKPERNFQKASSCIYHMLQINHHVPSKIRPHEIPACFTGCHLLWNTTSILERQYRGCSKDYWA